MIVRACSEINKIAKSKYPNLCITYEYFSPLSELYHCLEVIVQSQNSQFNYNLNTCIFSLFSLDYSIQLPTGQSSALPSPIVDQVNENIIGKYLHFAIINLTVQSTPLLPARFPKIVVANPVAFIVTLYHLSIHISQQGSGNELVSESSNQRTD